MISRSKNLTNRPDSSGNVLYWMQREKRFSDNWALLRAQKLAIERKSSLIVAFVYVGQYTEANLRQYSFMFEGLKETSSLLLKKNIPFLLIQGNPRHQIPKLIEQFNIGTLVTDFSPLKVYKRRTESVATKINIPFHQVDAHNIIPVWETSNKQEWSAYTIRPKILSKLPKFLVDFPKVTIHPFPLNQQFPRIDWRRAYNNLKIDETIKSVLGLIPGESEAHEQLSRFKKQPIEEYMNHRNDPNRKVLTNLSPYLHFGQISPQRVALSLWDYDKIENKGILEQLIVRRELADNFCYYNCQYDEVEGFPKWAKKSLNEHREDKREHVYNPDQLERGKTHDDLWNAAQNEMVITGKMHTYMRMYWAKKILEWSSNPETALQTAIDLNDKYELDGRDPNGYTGIAWSIGGLHDRAWFERPVFGKVRYMSYKGCQSKFDVRSYIQKINSILLAE